MFSFTCSRSGGVILEIGFHRRGRPEACGNLRGVMTDNTANMDTRRPAGRGRGQGRRGWRSAGRGRGQGHRGWRSAGRSRGQGHRGGRLQEAGKWEPRQAPTKLMNPAPVIHPSFIQRPAWRNGRGRIQRVTFTGVESVFRIPGPSH